MEQKCFELVIVSKANIIHKIRVNPDGGNRFSGKKFQKRGRLRIMKDLRPSFVQIGLQHTERTEEREAALFLK